MSTLPDNEFDLEKLFLPAWAQEAPSSVKYAKYEGEAPRPEGRGERRGPRFGNRDGAPGGRRSGPRPGGGRRPNGTPGQGAPPGMSDRGPRSERSRRHDHSGNRRGEPMLRREPPLPLPEIDVAVVPDEKGVESLARQIKMSGRAYPLFDIAQMILQKPERHGFVFRVKKNPEGQPIQPLFVCALDDTLWLSEGDAVSHVLRKHFSTFYQADRTATEPPKGKYTFVAQCGMSGTIFGPPNHHDYQAQLRKLHAERFSRMPFEVYKSRVKIVRDEEVVKKWVEDQSWKTEYVCLNMPEPLRLSNMEAVETHFRENHKDVIIKQVESHTASGTSARGFRSPEISRLVRSVWEDQRRFPLQIATVLSQQFAGHGLQFFKVNRTITHVSVARPHYLDLALTPVSDGVKRIVDFINGNSKCTRRQLIEALAPSPTPAPIPVTEGAAPAPTEPSGPTPEQTLVIADLHWLVHQGHVIEFANGILETAKKPVPKPPKPEPKASEKPAESVAAASAAGASEPVAAPAAEIAASASVAAGAASEGATVPEEPSPVVDSSAPVVQNGGEPHPAGEPLLESSAQPGAPSAQAQKPEVNAPSQPAPEPPVVTIGSPS